MLLARFIGLSKRPTHFLTITLNIHYEKHEEWWRSIIGSSLLFCAGAGTYYFIYCNFGDNVATGASFVLSFVSLFLSMIAIIFTLQDRIKIRNRTKLNMVKKIHCQDILNILIKLNKIQNSLCEHLLNDSYTKAKRDIVNTCTFTSKLQETLKGVGLDALLELEYNTQCSIKTEVEKRGASNKTDIDTMRNSISNIINALGSVHF